MVHFSEEAQGNLMVTHYVASPVANQPKTSQILAKINVKHNHPHQKRTIQSRGKERDRQRSSYHELHCSCKKKNY